MTKKPAWADRVREILRQQGRYDWWLAQLLGMHPSQFSRTMNGDPQYPLQDAHRERLPLILGVPAEMIFDPREG